jgi:hypothetical protein
MARLRSVNGVDTKAARLISRAGKDFEIQTHGRSLYAKASDVETRSFQERFAYAWLAGGTAFVSSFGSDEDDTGNLASHRRARLGFQRSS